MVKSDPETIMEATSTAHFSGLHFDDEYPVLKANGANTVPFVIGTNSLLPNEFTTRRFVFRNLSLNYVWMIPFCSVLVCAAVSKM